MGGTVPHAAGRYTRHLAQLVWRGYRDTLEASAVQSLRLYPVLPANVSAEGEEIRGRDRARLRRLRRRRRLAAAAAAPAQAPAQAAHRLPLLRRPRARELQQGTPSRATVGKQFAGQAQALPRAQASQALPRATASQALPPAKASQALLRARASLRRAGRGRRSRPRRATSDDGWAPNPPPCGRHSRTCSGTDLRDKARGRKCSVNIRQPQTKCLPQMTRVVPRHRPVHEADAINTGISWKRKTQDAAER